MNGYNPDHATALVAQGRVTMVALEVVQCVMAEPSAHREDALQYAEEQLALAARELVWAVDSLPANARPVGW